MKKRKTYMNPNKRYDFHLEEKSSNPNPVTQTGNKKILLGRI
jgi:hypothetical protein